MSQAQRAAEGTIMEFGSHDATVLNGVLASHQPRMTHCRRRRTCPCVVQLITIAFMFSGSLAFVSSRALTQSRLSKGLSAVRVYFDVAVANDDVGRLVCCIPDAALFPLHTKNFITLCSQSRRSIDTRLSYKGCEFQYSPQFVQSFPQYRWGHMLPGRGRNAVGGAEDRLREEAAMQDTTHKMYGGIYYGLEYNDSIPGYNEGTAVLLTVPMAGPGRGSTAFSLVRVGESPMEWRERLLLNTAVIGWLEQESLLVLRTMANQNRGPPKIKECGVLA